MEKIRHLLFLVCGFIFFFTQTMGQKNESQAIINLPPAIIIDPKNPPNCEACSPNLVKINISPEYSINFYNNNSLSLFQNIVISTTPLKYIKSVKAELSYFEFLPDNENCLVCNKEAATYGNFNTGMVSNQVGSGGGTHALVFVFPPLTALGSFPVQFNISMPPTVNCCNANVRFCIRYSVTFDDCTVCNVLVCYDRKMQGGLLMEQPIAGNTQNKQP